MLKRVVITNYLGEPVTYKIGDKMDPPHINRLPITIENIKALNTSGTWDGDNYQDPNSTVIFTIHHDKNGIVKSISATGAAGMAERSLILAECSFKESDENYVLSGATNPGNRKGYIKTAVRMKNSHDVYNWYNAFDNVNGDTILSGENSKVQLPSDYSPTYLHRFYFSVTFLKPASETVSVYPMVRLASEISGYVPYYPDSDPDTEWGAEDTSGLLITSIDGLGPVKGTINMVDLPTTDGGVFNSARLSTRNIVIKGLFTNATSIEDARLLSYKYFPVKKKVHLKIVTDNRTVETDGYVESNEPVIFDQGCGCQISILCENPYFNGDEIVSSFNASESPKSIIYTGDSDTGIEMSFDLGPTDDIMASYRVTKIEVTKDGDKTMGLDMSKMSGLVTNTAPNEAPQDTCFFMMNSNKTKFISYLPFDTWAVTANHRDGVPIIYKNELHYFYQSDDHIPTGGYDRHIKWNATDRKWEELPNVSGGTNKPRWIVNFNETVYILASRSSSTTSYGYIYRFDDANNAWIPLTSVTVPSYVYGVNNYGTLAVVHNNAIHIFSTRDDNGSPGPSYHYKWDGVSTKMTNLTNSSFTQCFSGEHTLKYAVLTKVGNAIHILGGNVNDTYHAMWDGDESNIVWSRLADRTPDSRNDAAITYNGLIYLFNGKYYYTYHNGEWSERKNLDFAVESSVRSLTPVATDGNYIYIVGWQQDGGSKLPPTYTEEANNIKLIENDKIVVNTKKGQKSVHLLREGKEYNVLNIANKDLSWFELNRGENKFSFSAEGDESELKETVKANILYEGV